MRDDHTKEPVVDCYLCHRLTPQSCAFVRKYHNNKPILFRCMVCETERRINQNSKKERPAIVVIGGALADEVAEHVRLTA